jgi:hypothetical protein
MPSVEASSTSQINVSMAKVATENKKKLEQVDETCDSETLKIDPPSAEPRYRVEIVSISNFKWQREIDRAR